MPRPAPPLPAGLLRAGLLLAGLLLMLGGCGYTPQQLGITGPGTNHTPVASHASEEEQDATIPAPGLPADFGARYAPALTPGGGQQNRFYGYN